MRGLLLGAAACLLAACSILRPSPDPSRFYVLTAVAASEAAGAANGQGPALGVGPVALPGYLERPELVTRVAPNEMRPADYHRWAEPLRTQFERTLGQNLSRLLGTDRVLTFPWWRGMPLDFIVQVDVSRFEPDAERGVHLVARWIVRDGPRGTLLRAGDTDLVETVASDDPDAVVAALSHTLGRMSGDIADAIRALERPRG